MYRQSKMLHVYYIGLGNLVHIAQKQSEDEISNEGTVAQLMYFCVCAQKIWSSTGIFVEKEVGTMCAFSIFFQSQY